MKSLEKQGITIKGRKLFLRKREVSFVYKSSLHMQSNWWSTRFVCCLNNIDLFGLYRYQIRIVFYYYFFVKS